MGGHLSGFVMKCACSHVITELVLPCSFPTQSPWRMTANRTSTGQLDEHCLQKRSVAGASKSMADDSLRHREGETGG
jgi:hypothetical protein